MRESGFTLLEAVIALFVLALGLLGPLKMMAHSMASSGTANARNIAALQAASLASTIQSNPAFWRDGAGKSANISLKAGRIESDSVPALSSDANCVIESDSAPGALPCTAAQLAASDLVEWAKSLDGALASPSGAVRCEQAEDKLTRCAITIRWHEHFVSRNGAGNDSFSAATATAENAPRSFITYLSF